MSVRQYIGARYVPIFFDNNGSTEWVGNHSYEPLTIVTYLGNSYTSKKLVTPDIGNPASNPEYWASTGIYSSQIEQYRQQVEAVISDIESLDGRVDTVEDTVDSVEGRLDTDETNITNLSGRVDTAEGDIDSLETRMTSAEDDIDNLKNYENLKNRKILFIGDSYGTGSGGGYTVTPWPVLVAGYFSLTENVGYWNYSRGGTSFGYNDGAESNPNTGSNFCDLLRLAVNNLSAAEKEGITDIVIGGAINDWNHNETQISAGVGNFANIAKNYFPNAKVTFCSIASALVFEYKHPYFSSNLDAIIRACGANKMCFKKCDIDLLSNAANFNTDGIHPTQTGQNNIAKRVACSLLGGDANFSIGARGLTGSYFNFTTWCDGYNYYLKNVPTQFNFDSAFTIDSTWRKVDEFNITSLSGYRNVSNFSWQFVIPCCIKTSSGWTSGVNVCFEMRQSSSDVHKCELWIRQIGHFTGTAFTSFTALAMLPSPITNTLPVWAA